MTFMNQNAAGQIIGENDRLFCVDFKATAGNQLMLDFI